MYLRSVHVEEDEKVLHALVRQYPLGVLTTSIASTADEDARTTTFPLIQSTHIPWTLSACNKRLCGHMARANPHAKQLLSYVKGRETNDISSEQVCVLFTHATQSYVSPRFYVQTKPETGKVVPTWNYASVEVRGRLIVHGSSSTFLDDQLRTLTDENESRSLVASDEKGWNVGDAPDSYVETLKKAIVGLEIEIETIVGKFKMSQELASGDRQGVIAGFAAYKTHDAQAVADLVEERGRKKA